VPGIQYHGNFTVKRDDFSQVRFIMNLVYVS